MTVAVRTIVNHNPMGPLFDSVNRSEAVPPLGCMYSIMHVSGSVKNWRKGRQTTTRAASRLRAAASLFAKRPFSSDVGGPERSINNHLKEGKHCTPQETQQEHRLNEADGLFLCGGCMQRDFVSSAA